MKRLDKNNAIITLDGTVQEYLLDYYQSNNMSVISKMDYLPKISSIFKYTYKRNISYIVVCEDTSKLYEDLKLFQINFSEGIYFTTIERLEKYPFNEALFSFDSLGEKYSFSNMALIERKYHT